jgi:NADH:ubiquinone oxidoreductase subunit F (NADH-binding)
VVFQPHRFSRTAQFKAGFAAALALGDAVYLLDVYGAGEAPIDGGTTADLRAELQRTAPSLPVVYQPGDHDGTLAVLGGGLKPGRTLKAIIPGGSSSKVLKAGEKFKLRKKGPDGQMVAVETDLLDLPYDFDSLQQAGTMSGSGAVIVMDDTREIVDVLANVSEFYAHESCGQCTPCREGALWMSKALHRMTTGGGRSQDADYLLHIAQNIQGRTICAFGEAAAWPVLSFVKKFKDDFVARGKADEEARAKGIVPASHH